MARLKEPMKIFPIFAWVWPGVLFPFISTMQAIAAKGRYSLLWILHRIYLFALFIDVIPEIIVTGGQY